MELDHGLIIIYNHSTIVYDIPILLEAVDLGKIRSCAFLVYVQIDGSAKSKRELRQTCNNCWGKGY